MQRKGLQISRNHDKMRIRYIVFHLFFFSLLLFPAANAALSPSLALRRPAAFAWGCLPCFAGTLCLHHGSRQQQLTWLPRLAPLVGVDRPRRATFPRKPQPQPQLQQSPLIGAPRIIRTLHHRTRETRFLRLPRAAAGVWMWMCAQRQPGGGKKTCR